MRGWRFWYVLHVVVSRWKGGERRGRTSDKATTDSFPFFFDRCFGFFSPAFNSAALTFRTPLTVCSTIPWFAYDTT